MEYTYSFPFHIKRSWLNSIGKTIGHPYSWQGHEADHSICFSSSPLHSYAFI